MGPNKNINSISKICRAANGIKEIVENFDKELEMHKRSVQNKSKKSMDDELEMIQDILTIRPFTYLSQRSHASFPDIKRSPLLYLNITEFHKWLDRHKQEITLHV